MLCSGYVNIYRAGKFHRVNKPGTCNVHPGDIYLSVEDAMKNIDDEAGYIGTTTIEWEQSFPLTRVPDTAVPIPLAQTQQMHRIAGWKTAAQLAMHDPRFDVLRAGLPGNDDERHERAADAV